MSSLIHKYKKRRGSTQREDHSHERGHKSDTGKSESGKSESGSPSPLASNQNQNQTTPSSISSSFHSPSDIRETARHVQETLKDAKMTPNTLSSPFLESPRSPQGTQGTQGPSSGQGGVPGGSGGPTGGPTGTHNGAYQDTFQKPTSAGVQVPPRDSDHRISREYIEHNNSLKSLDPQTVQSNHSPLLHSSGTPWSVYRIQNAAPSPRFGHSANYIAARDGELFILGGIRDVDILNDLWVIDTNRLTGHKLSTEGAKVGPRVGHASLVIGNAHVLFGGDTKIEETDPLDDNLYLLNTSSHKWTVALPVGPRPCGRYGHSLSNIGPRVFLFGGQVDEEFYDDMWSFDLTSWKSPNCRWERVYPATPPPPPRTNHTVITYNDKLYLFGGANGDLWYSDTWRFDPLTRQWEQLECSGFVPAPCQGHAATVIKDTMYVFGGMSSQGVLIDQLYALKLTTLKWYTFQNLGPGPSPRSGHSLTAFDGEKILVWGGTKEENSAYVLDVSRITYPAEDSEELSSVSTPYLEQGDNRSLPNSPMAIAPRLGQSNNLSTPSVEEQRVEQEESINGNGNDSSDNFPTQAKMNANARNSMLFAKRRSVIMPLSPPDETTESPGLPQLTEAHKNISNTSLASGVSPAVPKSDAFGHIPVLNGSENNVSSSDLGFRTPKLEELDAAKYDTPEPLKSLSDVSTQPPAAGPAGPAGTAPSAPSAPSSAGSSGPVPTAPAPSAPSAPSAAPTPTPSAPAAPKISAPTGPPVPVAPPHGEPIETQDTQDKNSESSKHGLRRSHPHKNLSLQNLGDSVENLVPSESKDTSLTKSPVAEETKNSEQQPKQTEEQTEQQTEQTENPKLSSEIGSVQKSANLTPALGHQKQASISSVAENRNSFTKTPRSVLERDQDMTTDSIKGDTSFNYTLSSSPVKTSSPATSIVGEPRELEEPEVLKEAPKEVTKPEVTQSEVAKETSNETPKDTSRPETPKETSKDTSKGNSEEPSRSVTPKETPKETHKEPVPTGVEPVFKSVSTEPKESTKEFKTESTDKAAEKLTPTNSNTEPLHHSFESKKSAEQEPKPQSTPTSSSSSEDTPQSVLDELAQLRKQLNSYRQRDFDNEKHLVEEAKIKAEKEVAQLKDANAQLNRKNTSLNSQLTEFKQKSEHLESVMDTHMATLTDQQKSLDDARKTIEDQKEQVNRAITLQTEVNDLKVKLRTAESAQKHAEEQLEALNNSYNSLKTAHSDLSAKHLATATGPQTQTSKDINSDPSSPASEVSDQSHISKLVAMWSEFKSSNGSNSSQKNDQTRDLNDDNSSGKDEYRELYETQKSAAETAHNQLQTALKEQTRLKEELRNLSAEHAVAATKADIDVLNSKHDKIVKDLEQQHRNAVEKSNNHAKEIELLQEKLKSVESSLTKVNEEYKNALSLTYRQNDALTRTQEELQNSRNHVRRLEDQLQDASLHTSRQFDDSTAGDISQQSVNSSRNDQATLIIRDLRAQIVILNEELNEQREQILKLKKAALTSKA